jgi:hypothetical protein
LALLILGAIGVAGVIALATGGEKRQIAGSLTLFDSDFRSQRVGSTCSGNGGYSDLKAGTDVKVTDRGGEILGTSALGPGRIVSSGECDFLFDFDELPDSDFYVVTLGSGTRGELSYSRKEMVELDWTVSLVIGD